MTETATTTATSTAWQAALAAEHQAVFGYALLGPQLSGTDLTRAVTCSDEHETLRNRTETAMAAAGLTPVQSRADYPALYPVRTAAAARALAVRLEDDCAAAWRRLFAVEALPSGSNGSPRLLPDAQHALTASAVRATGWLVAAGSSRPSTAFPGIGRSAG